MTSQGDSETRDVSIIVVTRDRPKALSSCLRSIAPQITGNSEIIVIAGADSCCPTALVESVSSTCIIRVEYGVEANISKARNQGLKLATHDTVLFVDDDATVHVGWVDAYTDAFTRCPQACIAGGVVLDARTDDHSPEFAFGLIHPTGRQIEVRATQTDPGARGYCLSIKGCNFALRRDRSRVPVRFDEFFRFAFDETDLLLTLLEAGGEVMHVPDAVVDHLHAPGQYRSASPLQRDWHTEFASHTMFMLKHTHGLERLHGWGVISGRVCKHTARCVLAVTRGKCAMQDAWHAVRDAVLGVRSAKRSRGSA